MKKLSYALAVLVLSARPLLAGALLQPPITSPQPPGFTFPLPPTTVPEPSTMLLLAGGAALLGATAWRRRGR
jgi:hypothetical protein